MFTFDLEQKRASVNTNSAALNNDLDGIDQIEGHMEEMEILSATGSASGSDIPDMVERRDGVSTAKKGMKVKGKGKGKGSNVENKGSNNGNGMNTGSGGEIVIDFSSMEASALKEEKQGKQQQGKSKVEKEESTTNSNWVAIKEPDADHGMGMLFDLLGEEAKAEGKENAEKNTTEKNATEVEEKKTKIVRSGSVIQGDFMAAREYAKSEVKNDPPKVQAAKASGKRLSGLMLSSSITPSVEIKEKTTDTPSSNTNTTYTQPNTTTSTTQQDLSNALQAVKTAQSALDKAEKRGKSRQIMEPEERLRAAMQAVRDALDECGSAAQGHPVSLVHIKHYIEEISHVVGEVIRFSVEEKPGWPEDTVIAALNRVQGRITEAQKKIEFLQVREDETEDKNELLGVDDELDKCYVGLTKAVKGIEKFSKDQKENNTGKDDTTSTGDLLQRKNNSKGSNTSGATADAEKRENAKKDLNIKLKMASEALELCASQGDSVSTEDLARANSAIAEVDASLLVVEETHHANGGNSGGSPVASPTAGAGVGSAALGTSSASLGIPVVRKKLEKAKIHVDSAVVSKGVAEGGDVSQSQNVSQTISQPQSVSEGVVVDTSVKTAAKTPEKVPIVDPKKTPPVPSLNIEKAKTPDPVSSEKPVKILSTPAVAKTKSVVPKIVIPPSNAKSNPNSSKPPIAPKTKAATIVPKDAAPKDSAPKISAPKDSAPKISAPKTSTPKASTPSPKDPTPKVDSDSDSSSSSSSSSLSDSGFEKAMEEAELQDLDDASTQKNVNSGKAVAVEKPENKKLDITIIKPKRTVEIDEVIDLSFRPSRRSSAPEVIPGSFSSLAFSAGGNGGKSGLKAKGKGKGTKGTILGQKKYDPEQLMRSAINQERKRLRDGRKVDGEANNFQSSKEKPDHVVALDLSAVLSSDKLDKLRKELGMIDGAARKKMVGEKPSSTLKTDDLSTDPVAEAARLRLEHLQQQDIFNNNMDDPNRPKSVSFTPTSTAKSKSLSKDSKEKDSDTSLSSDQLRALVVQMLRSENIFTILFSSEFKHAELDSILSSAGLSDIFAGIVGSDDVIERDRISVLEHDIFSTSASSSGDEGNGTVLAKNRAYYFPKPDPNAFAQKVREIGGSLSSPGIGMIGMTVLCSDLKLIDYFRRNSSGTNLTSVDSMWIRSVRDIRTKIAEVMYRKTLDREKKRLENQLINIKRSNNVIDVNFNANRSNDTSMRKNPVPKSDVPVMPLIVASNSAGSQGHAHAAAVKPAIVLLDNDLWKAVHENNTATQNVGVFPCARPEKAGGIFENNGSYVGDFVVPGEKYESSSKGRRSTSREGSKKSSSLAGNNVNVKDDSMMNSELSLALPVANSTVKTDTLSPALDDHEEDVSSNSSSWDNGDDFPVSNLYLKKLVAGSGLLKSSLKGCNVQEIANAGAFFGLTGDVDGDGKAKGEAEREDLEVLDELDEMMKGGLNGDFDFEKDFAGGEGVTGLKSDASEQELAEDAEKLDEMMGSISDMDEVVELGELGGEDMEGAGASGKNKKGSLGLEIEGALLDDDGDVLLEETEETVVATKPTKINEVKNDKVEVPRDPDWNETVKYMDDLSTSLLRDLDKQLEQVRIAIDKDQARVKPSFPALVAQSPATRGEHSNKDGGVNERTREVEFSFETEVKLSQERKGGKTPNKTDEKNSNNNNNVAVNPVNVDKKSPLEGEKSKKTLTSKLNAVRSIIRLGGGAKGRIGVSR